MWGPAPRWSAAPPLDGDTCARVDHLQAISSHARTPRSTLTDQVLRAVWLQQRHCPRPIPPRAAPHKVCWLPVVRADERWKRSPLRADRTGAPRLYLKPLHFYIP